jgi:broad specificity phosphatase PhoE
MIRAMERVDASTNGAPATVAVVSHGTAIRVLATALLELPLESARNLAQDNAALNLFEFRKPRWILRTWNDTTHCNGLEQE